MKPKIRLYANGVSGRRSAPTMRWRRIFPWKRSSIRPGLRNAISAARRFRLWAKNSSGMSWCMYRPGCLYVNTMWNVYHPGVSISSTPGRYFVVIGNLTFLMFPVFPHQPPCVRLSPHTATHQSDLLSSIGFQPSQVLTDLGLLVNFTVYCSIWCENSRFSYAFLLLCLLE